MFCINFFVGFDPGVHNTGIFILQQELDFMNENEQWLFVEVYKPLLTVVYNDTVDL